MGFRIDENGTFRGTVEFLDLVPNAGTISNGHVNAAAGIAASKLQHQYRAVNAETKTTTPAARNEVVHIAVGAGTVIEVKAGILQVCAGNATITVDLLVNGTTILTGAITIDSGDAAYALVEGTVDDGTLAVGDVIEIEIAVDAGTGTLGKGLFVYADITEAYE